MERISMIEYKPSLRANERLKDIKAYCEYHNKEISTNEIIDSGIHVFELLQDININEQLLNLQSVLDNLTEDYTSEQLEYAKDISKFIFSAMTVKKGVLGSEVFETVTQPLETMYFVITQNENTITDEYIKAIQKELKDISKSLDIWIEKE
jgi:hypothetical protein